MRYKIRMKTTKSLVIMIMPKYYHWFYFFQQSDIRNKKCRFFLIEKWSNNVESRKNLIDCFLDKWFYIQKMFFRYQCAMPCFFFQRITNNNTFSSSNHFFFKFIIYWMMDKYFWSIWTNLSLAETYGYMCQIKNNLKVGALEFLSFWLITGRLKCSLFMLWERMIKIMKQ